MTSAAAGELDALRSALDAARRAAREASRDAAGLVRLLEAIGRPGTPQDLLERAVEALSEVFSADVVALASTSGGQADVRATWGASPDAVLRLPGLTALPDLLSASEPLSWTAPPGRPVPEVAGVPVRHAARVPLSDARSGVMLLVRSVGAPFTAAELRTARSVALRLRSAVEDGERRAAVERLAQSGHRLARHLGLEPLLQEAVAVLRAVSGAEWTSLVVVEDGTASLAAEVGMPAAAAASWPRRTEDLVVWPSAGRGELHLSTDLGAGPAPLSSALRGEARSLLCVPVHVDGDVVALLYAVHSKPCAFGAAASETASLLVGYLSAAMVNARLYRTLAESESRLRAMTDELAHRATHDALTGLANRTLVHQRLEEVLAERSDGPDGPDGAVGLLFCDLDGFKRVNDRLGHEAGDELLRQVAGRLSACVRGEDLLARLGGDEFVVVLPGLHGLLEVEAVGRRVLASLQEPFPAGGELVRIGASVGAVAGAAGDGRSATDLLRDADAAMYAAKRSGRGGVAVLGEAAVAAEPWGADPPHRP